MAGAGLIKPIESLWGGFGSIFSKLTGCMSDLAVDTEAAPPIIPEGTYQINEYTVEGKIIIQQKIGVSSGNNYYNTDIIYWNPENPAYIMDIFYGWNTP